MDAKKWKQNLKISNTALTLFLWVISKIKRGLKLNAIFSETTYVCVPMYKIVYQIIMYQISIKILTSFRQGAGGGEGT